MEDVKEILKKGEKKIVVGTECLVMIEVKVTSLSESMRDSLRYI